MTTLKNLEFHKFNDETTISCCLPDVVYAFAHRIWLIQSLVALIYCFRHRILIYNDGQTRRSFYLNQFNLILVTNLILYMIELGFTQIIWLDSFSALHHLFACSLFYLTLKHHRHNLCASFILPFTIHSLYWIVDMENQSFSWPLLYLYNVSLSLASIIQLAISINKHLNPIKSFRMPMAAMLIMWSNLLDFFYAKPFNVDNICIEQLLTSLWLSSMIMVPFLLALIAVNFKPSPQIDDSHI